MQSQSSLNAFLLLRQQRLQEATRVFSARGKSVQRCERCQLAAFACICSWCPQLHTACDFVLLMHRDEVLKPTNTGRLLADVFPANTHAFVWSRTEPSASLIELLRDNNRQCFIVFPCEQTSDNERPRQLVSTISTSEKRPTFILLDGTWKQSSRMFHLSRWLDDVACVALPEGNLRGYAVRKSHQENYLSTAEAGALCLQMINESNNSHIFLQYFQLFNQHYVATRSAHPPEQGDVHRLLANYLSV